MSEQKKLTLEEEMKANNLNEELAKNALDFIQFLDETCGNYHLGESICIYIICREQFLIFFGHQSIVSTSDFENFPISDEIKEFAWSSVNECRYCGKEMPAGMTIQSNPCRQGDNIIFGKKYDNLCHCPIFFYAPDAQNLEKLKKFLLKIKQKRDCLNGK